MSIVQRRILEQLGAAGLLIAAGCRDPELASPDAPGTATSSPVSSGAAAASGEPAATATAAAPAGTGEVGATCKTAEDCKPGLHCRLGFDGAEFTETGQCTTERPVYRGRPLVVDGAPRVAELELGAERGVADADAWASYFARAAAEEHASVAAFARTLCQLMALGAPLGLLERTQAALADELEHTRTSLAWLARYAGAEAVPGRLPEALAPLAPGHGDEAELARALLVDVLRGGCVGEALAAEAMLARADEAPAPELASWLRRVADDEARHAALAFETAMWLVAQRSELAALVAEECARLDAHARRLVVPLFEASGMLLRAAA